jgi:hypothetical protein
VFASASDAFITFNFVIGRGSIVQPKAFGVPGLVLTRIAAMIILHCKIALRPNTTGDPSHD